MPARPFLDTNILIYAFASGDKKEAIAEQLLSAGGVVSILILNEFASVSSRKLALSWEAISERIELVTSLTQSPIPLTLEIHQGAITIARDRKISFYDALVVASALSARCDVLYTEDLQDGTNFGSLTVRNPFAV